MAIDTLISQQIRNIISVKRNARNHMINQPQHEPSSVTLKLTNQNELLQATIARGCSLGTCCPAIPPVRQAPAAAAFLIELGLTAWPMREAADSRCGPSAKHRITYLVSICLTHFLSLAYASSPLSYPLSLSLSLILALTCSLFLNRRLSLSLFLSHFHFLTFFLSLSL